MPPSLYIGGWQFALQTAGLAAQEPSRPLKKVFLYERLTKALLAELAGGLFAPGQRFLSKRKITQRWAVSDPTAKSALHWLADGELIEARPRSGFYVRAGSQKRALLLLHRLRTPSLLAEPGWETRRHQLRRAATKPHPPKVAVILAAFPGTPKQLPSPMKGSMLRAFECADAIWQAATARQVSLEFFLDNGQPDRRRQIVSQILALKPDGVIALRRLVSYVPLQTMLQPLVESGLPVVTVFDDCEGLPVHSINENNVALGYQAAHRFLRLGHRRIAVLLPRNGGDYFDDRAVGCEQACRESNVPLDNLRVVRLALNRPFAPPLRRLFSARATRPTAVFSSTATFLPELLRTLKRSRLSVPGDVSLIMTASLTQSPEMSRAVDTLLVDFPKMGRLALQVLMEVLSGKAAERSTLVDLRYAASGTVAAPLRR